MNALLARHGGVALHATTITFKPLDAWWDDVLAKQAVFQGVTYPHIRATVRFLMALKEGLFRSVPECDHCAGHWHGGRHEHRQTQQGCQGAAFCVESGTITPVQACAMTPAEGASDQSLIRMCATRRSQKRRRLVHRS